MRRLIKYQATMHVYLLTLLIVMLAACGQDTTVISRQLVGRWEQEAYFVLAADGGLDEIPGSGVSLFFREDGTYTRLYHVGNSEYRGTYRAIDRNHIKIDITQTPNNKGGSEEVQEFYIDNNILTIVTETTKEIYRRI